MDFTKLNLEFANMQKTVEDYNKMSSSINARIKDNLRIIIWKITTGWHTYDTNRCEYTVFMRFRSSQRDKEQYSIYPGNVYFPGFFYDLLC